MIAYFADTSFWIALSSRRDAHHARAAAWSLHLTRTNATIVTTEAVIWEWMNALSDRATRQTAAAAYRQCHRDPSIEVVPFQADLVDAAVNLYEGRHDKAWGLTDCLSFVVMSERHLTHALTADHHFQQAGFDTVLLRDPPERGT